MKPFQGRLKVLRGSDEITASHIEVRTDNHQGSWRVVFFEVLIKANTLRNRINTVPMIFGPKGFIIIRLCRNILWCAALMHVPCGFHHQGSDCARWESALCPEFLDPRIRDLAAGSSADEHNRVLMATVFAQYLMKRFAFQGICQDSLSENVRIRHELASLDELMMCVVRRKERRIRANADT